MSQNLIRLFNEIQNVPNVPFLTSQIEKFIESKLNDLGRQFINNKYSIVCNYPANPGKPKLIIMCHTDHPGVVMKNRNEGILFGTPGIKRLRRKIKTEGLVTYKVFSPKGKYLGLTKLIGIKNDNRTGIFMSDMNIPINSFAQYNEFNYFQETKDKFKVYNADDGIAFATMLSLIEEKDLKSKYDTYWVFNMHEEVHQVSAWYMAKNNILKIDRNDLILNLECQKVENINSKKYKDANYNNGLILQLSNTGCLFGYKSKKKNLTETLLREASNKEGIKLQTGFVKDSCDSRPYSYFNQTSNIATLNIPNKYKHNENEKGEVIPEEIFKNDVDEFYKIVKCCMTIELETLRLSKTSNLSKNAKMNDDITDNQLMEDKANLNNRIAYSYKSIVERGYFYPNNLRDYIEDVVGKVFFYLSFIQKGLPGKLENLTSIFLL